MSVVRLPFSISLSVDGESISANTLRYSHSINSTFATITIDIGGQENFIFPRSLNAPLHPVTYSIMEGLSLKSILSGDGIITSISLTENKYGSSCSITIMPSAFLLDSVNSVFNGVNSNGSYLQDYQDASTLILAIVAQHNNETGQNVTLSMDCGTFLTTLLPRFFGVSYLSMINSIISPRGLLARIGFDNILRVVSFSQSPSSDMVLTVDSTDSISYSSNELAT